MFLQVEVTCFTGILSLRWKNQQGSQHYKKTSKKELT